MNKEEIRQAVLRSLDVKASYGATWQFNFMSYLGDLTQLGHEWDADAVCFITKIQGQICVVFLVGRSVLFSEEANCWLTDYHNGSPSAIQKAIDKIVDFIFDEFEGEEYIAMPFINSKNKIWRSFRMQDGSLPTVDDVRKKAFIKLGKKI